MKTEYPIPTDATHYFLWWDGLHVYKKDGNNWQWLIMGQWKNIPNLCPVRGWFSYHVNAMGYKHKLHEIPKGIFK